MDTQGYDLKTFAGAQQHLDTELGLQSEVSFLPIHDGILRLLDQLATSEAGGFSPAGMHPLSRHRTSLGVTEWDVVMVKDQISGLAK